VTVAVLLAISGRARARPRRAAGGVRTDRGLRGAVPRPSTSGPGRIRAGPDARAARRDWRGRTRGDVHVPRRGRTDGLAHREKERLVLERRVEWRGNAEFFGRLAPDGVERMLAGLDVSSGRQPQAGQPVVAEQHAPGLPVAGGLRVAALPPVDKAEVVLSAGRILTVARALTVPARGPVQLRREAV
jgi:hypothetical protein